MEHHDVIIVGGRVAGAATALLLARAGHDVLVLERDRRGTDTLSTHALMRAGVLQLRRWGLLDEVVAAGTPPQERVVFHYGPERVDVDLSSALYAPRRTVLDAILVAAAEVAGAEFRFGVDVRGLRWDGERVCGVVTRRGRATHDVLDADVVIGADGRRSVVARDVAPAVTRTGSAATGVLYGYWSGVETAGYEWAFTPGAMAGLIPTNDGQVCVYAGTDRQRFVDELRHDLDGAIERVVKETSSSISDRIAAGTRTERVRGFAGVRGWMRRPWGPGWALVGDAGYFKDPATAHGISDALRDAELLARSLHPVLGGVVGWDGLARYESERDRVSTDLFAITDRIAGLDWDLPGVRALHVAMSAAMEAECDLVTDFGPPAAG